MSECVCHNEPHSAGDIEAPTSAEEGILALTVVPSHTEPVSKTHLEYSNYGGSGPSLQGLQLLAMVQVV